MAVMTAMIASRCHGSLSLTQLTAAARQVTHNQACCHHKAALGVIVPCAIRQYASRMDASLVGKVFTVGSQWMSDSYPPTE